jgi:hypothetical protein
MSFKKYDPSNYDFLVFMNLILNENHQDLFLLTENEFQSSNTIPDFFKSMFLNWACMHNVKDYRKIDIPDFYYSRIYRLKKDPKTRFIQLPLMLHHKSKCKDRKGDFKHDNHMNMLIYDKKNNTLEIFDSSATSDYEIEILYNVMINIFQYTFNLKIDAFKSAKSMFKNILPIQESQESESTNGNIGVDSGFCSIYSLLYLEMRLKNRDMSSEKLTQIISNDMKNEKTKYIQDYITSLVNKRNIIEKEIKDKDMLKVVKKDEGHTKWPGNRNYIREFSKVMRKILNEQKKIEQKEIEQKMSRLLEEFNLN